MQSSRHRGSGRCCERVVAVERGARIEGAEPAVADALSRSP
jgi:hypothetical protein